MMEDRGLMGRICVCSLRAGTDEIVVVVASLFHELFLDTERLQGTDNRWKVVNHSETHHALDNVRIFFVSKALKRSRECALKRATHSSLVRPFHVLLPLLCKNTYRTFACQPIFHQQIPTTAHMDEGYSITRTEAPKERGGRLRLNCARTTPELPRSKSYVSDEVTIDKENSNNKDTRRTMCVDNRSPNHSQLGAAHLFTRTIDKRTAFP